MRMVKTQNEVEQDFLEDAVEMDSNEFNLEELDEVTISLDDELDFDFETEDKDECMKEVDLEEITDEEQEKDVLEEFKIPIEEIIPSISKSSKRIPEAGVLSVVNSKSGKRVSIANEVIEHIGQPMSIQIGFLDKRMVISEYLGDAYTSYNLKKQGTKQVVYNKDLVEQITNHYQLDFTGRTSVTFSIATYQKMGDGCVAIITMI